MANFHREGNVGMTKRQSSGGISPIWKLTEFCMYAPLLLVLVFGIFKVIVDGMRDVGALFSDQPINSTGHGLEL